MLELMTRSQRARRYAITWRVRLRRINERSWSIARAVNLSVSGILLQVAQCYRVGEQIEVEIDCLIRPEIKTILRAVGQVVRVAPEAGRRSRLAIHFDVNGAVISVNDQLSVVGSR